MTADTPHPKLFISYSWTTPMHEQWVMDLAERLAEDDVDVIIDKWALRESHDAHAFMEQMVTDPEITKVIMICDAAYVEKANRRARGVGTETQIITGEIYSNTTQDKFVAVIAEKDGEGHAMVPVYYKGRIHIDLADAGRYEEEYERLLRWLYDQPVYVKPSRGKKPAFLSETPGARVGNRSAMKRALDQLRDGKPAASGALGDYLSSVDGDFEGLRIGKVKGVEFDDQVVQSIESFLPTRDELLAVIQAVARYQPSDENVQKIHRFFEALLRYYFPTPSVMQWMDTDFDNFVFITYELYLHTLAIFIDAEQFGQARYLIATDFYVGRNHRFGNEPMVAVSSIDGQLKSLEYRNSRLNLRRESVQADLLRDRSKSGAVRFESLVQADVILYLYFKRKPDCWWYPLTTVFLGMSHSALPVFARANSKRYFHKLRVLLGFDTADQMREWIREMESGNALPKSGFHRLPLGRLTAAEQLAIKE
ncbi:SEFIR domain-containing protein [Paraburkholderia phenazinium]|uniref:SEFIR domain-containing protein n=1 Tax=Paraburkholderia phenazinium TaxID=60549 RepID=UPI0015895982|nr:SEFIR domain-containing protein [Paraburkholderia phenazinium]